ncbi:MAG: GDSL-type esterase/lipase family protein [Eubacteriales bacterium]|nr:GDSL-type esterase/lipase family protein [Eubacteriales bacterium]MDD3882935.1 GDSL-type esterase/lipase family protein [Eubacteriales bacterium]MDD4513518.1 GDSL-type esterase/lipase family protein [Eubacteriales bacterium]
MKFIKWNDAAIRLTGRWSRPDLLGYDSSRFINESPDFTVTTAAGSYFELGFSGRLVVLHFELNGSMEPRLHLWISVDGGAMAEAPIDRYLRVLAPSGGEHTLRVIFKGAMEMQPRWYAPQTARVAFIGADVEDTAPLAADNRAIIEFVGDSITEGVLIDADFAKVSPNAYDQMDRPYQDDACATYAWLTAEKLNMRPIFQAYGAVGLTRSGCGGVPRAALIYPYVIEGVRYVGEKPDVIVINHGANDCGASAEEYIERYGELLDTVSRAHPKAKIIVLSPFLGAFDAELRDFVKAYNEKNQSSVHFISSKGWVPPEPLHPLREGHRRIASLLAPELEKIL